MASWQQCFAACMKLLRQGATLHDAGRLTLLRCSTSAVLSKLLELLRQFKFGSLLSSTRLVAVPGTTLMI